MPKPETETNSNSAVETTCVATTVNGINNLAVATVNAASTVPFAANSYNPFPHQTTTTAQLQMYQLPQYVPTCMYPYGGTTFSSAQVELEKCLHFSFFLVLYVPLLATTQQCA